MSARRNELTRAAARLFAEKGYHGTSIGDLAEALGVQKGSLYAHIQSKADLLWEVARDGAAAFHVALDTVPEEGPVVERIRAALRAHLHVVAEQLDVATVFVREWRYLEGERRAPPRASLRAGGRDGDGACVQHEPAALAFERRGGAEHPHRQRRALVRDRADRRPRRLQGVADRARRLRRDLSRLSRRHGRRRRLRLGGRTGGEEFDVGRPRLFEPDAAEHHTGHSDDGGATFGPPNVYSQQVAGDD